MRPASPRLALAMPVVPVVAVVVYGFVVLYRLYTCPHYAYIYTRDMFHARHKVQVLYGY